MAQRIKEINYQYLKKVNLLGKTDYERVDLAIAVLSGILKSVPVDVISDTEFPSTFLGCTVNWPYGDVANDKKIEITYGAEVLDIDLTYQYQRPAADVLNIATYQTAMASAIAINGTDSVPDTQYEVVDLATTLEDALFKTTHINTSEVVRR